MSKKEKVGSIEKTRKYFNRKKNSNLREFK